MKGVTPQRRVAHRGAFSRLRDCEVVTGADVTHPDNPFHAEGATRRRAPCSSCSLALGARMTSHNGYENVPGLGLYDTTGATDAAGDRHRGQALDRGNACKR